MKSLFTICFAIIILSGYSQKETNISTHMEMQSFEQIDRTIKYREVIDECNKLFNEYSFPNSHARPKNFDLTLRFDSTEKRRVEISKIFYSKNGMNILNTYINEEEDYVYLIGMLKICYESGVLEGKLILKEYLNCSEIALARFGEENCTIVSRFTRNYYDNFILRTSPENIEYTCSMHPEIIKHKVGKCPICAMDLIKKGFVSD